MNHTAIRTQYSTLMSRLLNFVKMLIYVAANDAQRKVTPVLCVTSSVIVNGEKNTIFVQW